MRELWGCFFFIFLLGVVKVFFSLSLKILTLEERGDKGIETQEERQGKMLLHTEYSLLSLLHNQEGVVHHHGLFQVQLVTVQLRALLVIAAASSCFCVLCSWC